jgi:hypothetical protein
MNNLRREIAGFHLYIFITLSCGAVILHCRNATLPGLSQPQPQNFWIFRAGLTILGTKGIQKNMIA